MSRRAQTFSKRFLALAVIGGLLVYCLVGGLTFWVLHNQASDRAANTVDYVKKQSLECELVNDANVMKSQIRVMQNASQAARDIDAGGGDVSEAALGNYVSDLHLTNMFVLDPSGKLVAGYQGDNDSFESLASYLTGEEILDVANHPKKVYATRLFFDDGAYADLACACRLDAPGVVVVTYHTEAEYANRFLLTLQSLLEGYRVANDTSVVVEHDGAIVASNTVDSNGQTSLDADAAIVDRIKESCEPGEMRLVKGDSAYYYGAFGKTRDYTVYTFSKASRLLHYVFSNALVGLTVYVLILVVAMMNRRRAEHQHLASMLEREQQHAIQLEEAVRVAEKANAAKTEFLQRMSHDLRTPLNGIRGMVEIGNANANDVGKQAECREKVWTASGVLLDLVNEALDMSKLESGQIALEVEAVDFDGVIDDVYGMLERQAAERKVSIVRQRGVVAHPCVKSSGLYLRRLFMNIATNAVKYNKFGGSVTIAYRELSFEAGVVTHQVTVADTGIGMSSDFQKHLFEPFAREEQKLDYRPSGTGLGLPIAKQLAELMGGTIACESELGRGTTCTITIPFEIADGCDGCADKTAAATATLAGLHVLLAEDNELNREIAEFVIKNAEATLCVAGNGREALELFESSSPGTFDAILMDIMMPVMDGYEAARAIRALAREDAKSIPIIAVSANAFADDRQRSYEAGMDAHIAKPLNAEELIRTISTLARR